jgi:hypothetical protein
LKERDEGKFFLADAGSPVPVGPLAAKAAGPIF